VHEPGNACGASPPSRAQARPFLHPEHDRSCHACLPLNLAQEAITVGWAELHPVARLGIIPPTTVMLYAPRDDEAAEIVCRLLHASYRFAGGRHLCSPFLSAEYTTLRETRLVE